MESLRRGASGMDAARAVKGHGWPLRGDPRSSDGMREVERSETRMSGARPFGSFWGDCQKELAQQGETMPSNNSINQPKTEPRSAIKHAAGCNQPYEAEAAIQTAR